MPPKRKTFIKPKAAKPEVPHSANPLADTPTYAWDMKEFEYAEMFADAKWLRTFIGHLESNDPAILTSMGLDSTIRDKVNTYAFNLDRAHWKLILAHTHCPRLRLSAVRDSFTVVAAHSAKLNEVDRQRDLLIYILLASSMHECGEYAEAEQFFSSVIDSCRRRGFSLDDVNVGWRSEIRMRTYRSMNFRALGRHAEADIEEAEACRLLYDIRLKQAPDSIRYMTKVNGQNTPVTREVEKWLVDFEPIKPKPDGSVWLMGRRITPSLPVEPGQLFMFDKKTKNLSQNEAPRRQALQEVPDFPYLHMPTASAAPQIEAA